MPDDGGAVHVDAKNASSEAMIAHVRGFLDRWADRFMACVDPTRFVVYGSPSEAGRELLAPFNGTYPAPWGGVAR